MYLCEICGRSFSRRDSLKRHWRTVSCDGKGMYRKQQSESSRGPVQKSPIGVNISVDIVIPRDQEHKKHAICEHDYPERDGCCRVCCSE